MSKEKRVIQINHALSGIYGEEMKTTCFRITETRKDILRKLERKKRLSSIIHDELYDYLEKFPEEKLGLHQEQFKKKKARLADFEQRTAYRMPATSWGRSKKKIDELQGIWLYPLKDLDEAEEV